MMNSNEEKKLLWFSSYHVVSVFAIVFLMLFTFSSAVASQSSSLSLFDQNYNVTWGDHHVRYFDNRRIVQLVLDRSSGSGFASKKKYLFGNFTMKMKLIHGDSSGTVTAFYLTSGESSGHDEVDFEFLGSRSGKMYRLQTNVFTNGGGDREERMRLWFDPTADFHDYSILWDSNQIIFLVDHNPVRVFKNLQKDLGVPYPSMKPMQVVSSLWNGENWATDGGKRKIKWKNSPFHVSFIGFEIQGCLQKHEEEEAAINTATTCIDNGNHYPLAWTILNQEKSLKYVRRHYITYSYCHDKTRLNHAPPECFANEL